MQYLLQILKRHLSANWFYIAIYFPLISKMYQMYFINTEGEVSY